MTYELLGIEPQGDGQYKLYDENGYLIAKVIRQDVYSRRQGRWTLKYSADNTRQFKTLQEAFAAANKKWNELTTQETT